MENELKMTTDDGPQTTGNGPQPSDNGSSASETEKPENVPWNVTMHPDYEKIKAIKFPPCKTVEQWKAICAGPGVLTQKAANTWMQESNALPVPKMLFSEFWREGEICILFADNSMGKSILGVQIGDSISKGEAIPGFKMECKKQPVLYFDFGLSGKQFESRYSHDFEDHYQFDEQFMRVEINPTAFLPGKVSAEEQLYNSIEDSLYTTPAKVVIIDNITYLGHEARRTSKVIKLMRKLQELKNKLNLSVLVIAHTAKRTLRRQISRDDVQGGKLMMQQCDSAFCIGESTSEKNLRYLKQVKILSTEEVFNFENVAACEIAKAHNFLQFKFLHYGMEWEMLKGLRGETRQEMIERIRRKSGEGKKQRQIAAEMGISLGAVNKYLNKV